MKKTCCSPFPTLNVHCRNELLAVDTVYCDTPAIDDMFTCARIFVGTKTLASDVYGMKSDKRFFNSLEDNIRKRGSMSKLISDSAQSEINK